MATRSDPAPFFASAGKEECALLERNSAHYHAERNERGTGTSCFSRMRMAGPRSAATPFTAPPARGLLALCYCRLSLSAEALEQNQLGGVFGNQKSHFSPVWR